MMLAHDQVSGSSAAGQQDSARLIFVRREKVSAQLAVHWLPGRQSNWPSPMCHSFVEQLPCRIRGECSVEALNWQLVRQQRALVSAPALNPSSEDHRPAIGTTYIFVVITRRISSQITTLPAIRAAVLLVLKLICHTHCCEATRWAGCKQVSFDACASERCYPSYQLPSTILQLSSLKRSLAVACRTAI